MGKVYKVTTKDTRPGMEGTFYLFLEKKDLKKTLIDDFMLSEADVYKAMVGHTPMVALNCYDDVVFIEKVDRREKPQWVGFNQEVYEDMLDPFWTIIDDHSSGIYYTDEYTLEKFLEVCGVEKDDWTYTDTDGLYGYNTMNFIKIE